MGLREARDARNAFPAELPERSQRLGMGRGGQDHGRAAQAGTTAALCAACGARGDLLHGAHGRFVAVAPTRSAAVADRLLLLHAVAGHRAF